MDGFTGERLFDRARKVPPAQVARAHGVRMRRAGVDRSRGACPLCESTDAFLADDKGPIWHCFSCGETGDAVALEMELGGHPDRVAAARVLAGDAERTTVERQRKPIDVSDAVMVGSEIVAAHIAGAMTPAAGSIVETWLSIRSIPIDLVRPYIGGLGFLIDCPVTPWRVGRGADSVAYAPAMIAPLRLVPDGDIVGVHATYLRPSGRGKADFGRFPDGKMRPSRKMWGRARGAACFMGDVTGAGPLVAGEGVETVLSYVAGFAAPCRPIAALSLDNLQGRAIRDDEGVVPLWNLRSDPASPPVTVPQAGEVHLLIDADMRPIELRCQLRRRGPRERVRIDGLRRSEICASLATQAWRRAGAGPVKAFRAPAGMDFNDLGAS